MQYLELDFTLNPCSEAATDVLAALLADAGAESFVAEADGLRAYIQTELFDAAAIDAAISAFPIEGTAISYSATPVPDEDWNATWEANGYSPISIDGRIVIHDEGTTDYAPARYDITIRPRQAFGTGSHETTRLVLRQLMDMNLDGATVVDAGCGTGILGIMCALRGASRIVAYDIDEWSTDNATYNFQLNRTSHASTIWPDVDIRHGDVTQLNDMSGCADLVLANINRNILLADMATFARTLKAGGKLLISGFLTDDVKPLLEHAATLGLHLVRHTTEAGWHLLAL